MLNKNNPVGHFLLPFFTWLKSSELFKTPKELEGFISLPMNKLMDYRMENPDGVRLWFISFPVNKFTGY